MNSRQLILDSATDLFATKGYAGTSISDITSAAGLQKSSLYSLFKNKDDLFFEVYKQAHNRSMIQLNSIHNDPTLTPLQKLHHIFLESCSDSNLNIFNMTFYPLPQLQDKLLEVFDEYHSNTIRAISDLFAQLRDEYDLSMHTDQELIDTYIIMMNGTMFSSPKAFINNRLDTSWKSFCEWANLI